MLRRSDLPSNLIEKVWAKVIQLGPDECWPYLGHRDKDGYGSYHWSDHGDCRVPRIIFVSITRDLEGEEQVRHTCDNPPCCNPGHLLAGLPIHNISDAIRRGRSNTHFPPAQGELNGNAKLTQTKVDAIRKEYIPRIITHKVLAQKYGVSASIIEKIIRRVYW